MCEDRGVEVGDPDEADATSDVGAEETADEEATVTLPVRALVGIPDETAPTPTVGRAALGSTVHPPEAAGQAGGVTLTDAAYWAELTPVGFKVTHCCWRLLKSGEIGVGTP